MSKRALVYGGMIAALAVLALQVSAGQLITFEEGAGRDREIINDQYEGITFEEASSGCPWIYADPINPTDNFWCYSSWPSGQEWGYPGSPPCSGEYWINDYVAAVTDISGGTDGRITFIHQDATFVQLNYCSAHVLYLDAYNAAGQLIDEDVGPANRRHLESNANGPGALRVDAPSGQRIAHVILHDHANFWVVDNVLSDATYSSRPTPSAVPATGTPFTSTPTRTPTSTSTPTPTPTPGAGSSSVRIKIATNQRMFHPGDPFSLDLSIFVAGSAITQDVFVVLAVYGEYWFWPSWIHYPGGIDWRPMALSIGENSSNILSFTWPDGDSAAASLIFFAGCLDPGSSYLRAMDDCVWDYGPEGGSPTATPTPGVGDIAFRLVWSNTNDLDLHVIEPSGEEIDYTNKTSGTGGQLDIDCNAACGNQCENPIENVFWTVGLAPRGTYRFWVHHYAVCSGPDPAPFTLKVFLGETEVSSVDGVVAQHERSNELTYIY